jgi:integrase
VLYYTRVGLKTFSLLYTTHHCKDSDNMQMSQNTIDSVAQDLPSAYLKVKQSKGLQDTTLYSYRQALKLFEDWRTKPYEELNQSDMAGYLNFLNSMKSTSGTRKLRVLVVKGYLRWVLSGNVINGKMRGPAPECVAYLEVMKDRKTKQQVHVTKKIMQEFLSECRTLKEQVFFSLLYDTGARKGEIVSLQIKHIGRDEYANYVELNGKTGYRKNYLHDSLAWYLPFVNGLGDNPEHYLFASREGPETPIRVKGPNTWCRRIIRSLKARGILQVTDRLTPHGFRHTKTRNLKNKGWSGDKLNLWMGWVDDSNMSTYYGKARPEDMVDSFLELTGQKKMDKEDTHLMCLACNTSQSTLIKFCPSCGHAMKPEYAFEQNSKKDTVEYIAEMQQAREILKTLRSLPHLAKELGLQTA